MMKKMSFVLASLILLTGCSGTTPDLGVNIDELAPCPKTPNCVNSQASDETHHIQPLFFKGTKSNARHRLLQILESEHRTEIVMIQDNYIRAEFTSAFFRFVDDVEFYFPEKKGSGTMIHVRSASRVGYFDFGANRKRIDGIRSKLGRKHPKE